MIEPLTAAGLLRCPVTREPLAWATGGWLETPGGERRYRCVEGVPVLISSENELFDLEDVSATASSPSASSLLRGLAARLPKPSRNVGARERFARVAQLLHASGGGARPRVLVLGGGTLGVGMEAVVEDPGLDVLETDVYLGPRTQLVCDAHQLPFEDEAFDAVVCQAVLEHVLDPPRVIAEVHRVLEPGGILYSEVPFMQQVHEGAYDFTRYTLLGHRRLLHRFDLIDWGAQGGPGMALAWSFQYFVMAFAGPSRRLRAALGHLAGVAVAWLTWLDPLLVRRPGGLDAASGTYVIGRRREEPVPDREIIGSYPGACPSPERVRPVERT